jgi:hypothetical protein
MTQAERSDLSDERRDPAEDLVHLVELEREARDGLIRAREQLLARDERFAAVEADLWAGFEERERKHRAELLRIEEVIESQGQQLEEYRAANTSLVEANHRLTVRLERVLDSAPGRLYRRLQALPGIRRIRDARTRGYERAVAARRHG